MGIVFNLEEMMAKRRMSCAQLSERIGVLVSSIAAIINGRVRSFKLSAIDSFCEIFEYQPGDMMEHRSEKPPQHIGS